MLSLHKQRGFGLSLLFLSVAAGIFAYSFSLVTLSESRYQVTEKDVFSSRVNVIADIARMHYTTDCTDGLIAVSDIEQLSYENVLDLKSYGVDNTEVEIKSHPRPHVVITLELVSSNPYLIESLVFANGNVSISGLTVSISLPLNFSSSSQGYFLHQDRQKNDNQICS